MKKKPFLSGILLIIIQLFLFWVITQGQETGAVLVSWDPNIEADLAGYRVYYGQASRSYSKVIDVGNHVSQRVDGLERDCRWYFAATAYDTANNESDFSEEVSIYLTATDDSSGDGGKDTTVVEVHFGYYNFPNPFDPGLERTNIRYYLREPETVSIDIYDDRENLVVALLRNQRRNAGEHFEAWDGRDGDGRMVRNGVYLAALRIGSETRVVQVSVIR